MSVAAVAPKKERVQRLVAYGLDLDWSRHCILKVTDPLGARRFLAELVARKLITDASITSDGLRQFAGAAGCAASIGFTFRGLQRLELEAGYLRVFEERARAFAEGASRRAARQLGDTGASAVDCWDDCFEREHAHVLLSLYADDRGALDDLGARLAGFPGADGLVGLREKEGCWLEGQHLTDRKHGRTVHFGFRDGIATPGIEGFHEPKAGRTVHKAGEFLLGYPNDNDFNPWLLINPSQRPNPWLLPLNRAPQLAEFFRDGSFAAFRQIEQHEEAFQGWVKKQSGDHPGVSVEAVKAKLAGRWRDGSVAKPDAAKAARAGAPAALGTNRDLELNQFTFADDPDGLGCPFGAHIRRMNPRADRVVPLRRRPLIRRGMPYGSAYVEDENPPKRRGLLGLFICASLEDQFEFLIGEWGNAMPMGPGSRVAAREVAAKDPFIANHQSARAVFNVPLSDERRCALPGMPPFVSTRGTLYAFFPSLPAVGRIARGGAP